MNFIISEEELIGFINKITKSYANWFVGLDDKAIAEDFFKSKQPVEVLAEGEFSDDWIIENDKLVMGSDITRKIYDLGFEGKRVQVLLNEVSK